MINLAPAHLASRIAVLFGRTPAPEVRAKARGPIPPRKVSAGMVGKGFVDPRHRAGVKRIVVTVEDATFERIREHAASSGVSFAAAVRQVIQRGLAPRNGKGG